MGTLGGKRLRLHLPERESIPGNGGLGAGTRLGKGGPSEGPVEKWSGRHVGRDGRGRLREEVEGRTQVTFLWAWGAEMYLSSLFIFYIYLLYLSFIFIFNIYLLYLSFILSFILHNLDIYGTQELLIT